MYAALEPIYSFFNGLFVIKDAYAAYASVDRFSSMCMSHGFKHANIKQKLFPPKLYLSRQVSFESL